jgi:hypothetical protein
MSELLDAVETDRASSPSTAQCGHSAITPPWPPR